MQTRRSIFLINKKFQLRFAFYVCSWLFALSLIYPLIISNLFDYFIRYIQLSPLGPPTDLLAATRKEMLWLLVWLQLVFLVITFLISIFLSHRIAGPLYKLQKSFDAVKGGNLDDNLHFRKKDHFPELAENFNGMIRTLKDRVKPGASSNSEAIRKIEAAIEHSAKDAREGLELALGVLRKS